MSNNLNKKNSEFVAREFQEVKGGYYDDYGFYYTPNGSEFHMINYNRFLG